jgi:hypothetical protein
MFLADQSWAKATAAGNLAMLKTPSYSRITIWDALVREPEVDTSLLRAPGEEGDPAQRGHNDQNPSDPTPGGMLGEELKVVSARSISDE